MKQREKIISDYIDAYNRFDIDGMVVDFDEAINFKNISNGKVNMSINGLDKFKEQAEQAKNLFTKRKQTLKSFNHKDDETEINIAYYAVLAVDLPNGLLKRDELNIEGKSIFKFRNGKIISITDIS